MPAPEIYSPEPNMLERKFAAHLSRRGAQGGTGDHPSRARQISRVTKWTIALAALAGMRHTII